eukprot:9462761-Alexandrium_andersonii.AAC.1
MSASLVGSEMCIRDRHLSQGGPPSAHVGPKGMALHSGVLDPEVHGTCPVSYTHLTLPTICSV